MSPAKLKQSEPIVVLIVLPPLIRSQIIRSDRYEQTEVAARTSRLLWRPSRGQYFTWCFSQVQADVFKNPLSFTLDPEVEGDLGEAMQQVSDEITSHSKLPFSEHD